MPGVLDLFDHTPLEGPAATMNNAVFKRLPIPLDLATLGAAPQPPGAPPGTPGAPPVPPSGGLQQLLTQLTQLARPQGMRF